MYWCKHYNKVFSILLCISGLAACRPDVHVNASSKRYFDLKAFINADSVKLVKANASVIKTVTHNNSSPQTKRIIIKNWGQELGLLAASDINKPAWRDSYRITKKGDSVIYTALLSQLFTRRISIQSTNGKVLKIEISNATKNLLYKTTEHLTYYPDSLYLIDKQQQVKLMGSNRYLIKGEITSTNSLHK
jgi:hypothetical protein